MQYTTAAMASSTEARCVSEGGWYSFGPPREGAAPAPRHARGAASVPSRSGAPGINRNRIVLWDPVNTYL